jgi:ring-1,2-phenylacetyl-CoA epoxidase subunit PaaC
MINYLLHLADNALVLGHRNSEWTGHGPILEQDIALSNISLDLIGQARNLYQYAAQQLGDNATEDTLAYLRGTGEFKNSLMAELPNGHWGLSVLRQFLFSAYQYPLYEKLSNIDNGQLAAIAAKSIKEVTYHLRWSSEWVIRLGRGTEESSEKMREAVGTLWPYTEDLLMPRTDDPVIGHANEIRNSWNARVVEVMGRAQLQIPSEIEMLTGGREGQHTEHLHHLLQEMQYMQRTYPGMEW